MPAGKRFSPALNRRALAAVAAGGGIDCFCAVAGRHVLCGVFDWQDERRDSLIQDILWLEQSMRSQLTEQQDWRCAPPVRWARGTLDEDRFQAASELILRENPEILSVELLNAQGQVEARAPASFRPSTVASRWPALKSAMPLTWRAARVSRHSAMCITAWTKQARVDLEAPVYRDHRFAGSVRLSYSLPGMLHHEVPWWIGQKYQIAIVDLGGKVIAAKFTVGERPGSLWHEIDFTPARQWPAPARHRLPPGHGAGVSAAGRADGFVIAVAGGEFVENPPAHPPPP